MKNDTFTLTIRKYLTLAFFCISLLQYKHSLAQAESSTNIDSLSKSIKAIKDEITFLKRLKISGYVQPQFQMIDSAGAPSFAGGDFVNGTGKYSSRFTVRRGRIKFTYTHNNIEIVLNPDISERGVFMRETYGKITDPWLKMFSLTAGLLQYQFGYDEPTSSAIRETPERARMFQLLFPSERDLGVFGSVVFPKTTLLNGLKIDIAATNGVAGINPEFDSYKDYHGRIGYSKTSKNDKVSFGIGVSYYNGGYRTGNIIDYNLKRSEIGDYAYGIAADTANYERKAQKLYYGADAQLSIKWKIGTTVLRGEYIQGEQPGTSSSSASARVVPTSKLYHRDFNGASFYFIQNLGKSKFQLVAKYDWYDPNVKIAGLDVGKVDTHTNNIGDIRFDTYGLGLNYYLDKNVKIVLYYDYIVNEKTLVTGYTNDIKDNVYTLRMQYRF
ncbi:MAG: porin [Bacteroidota bacterium]